MLSPSAQNWYDKETYYHIEYINKTQVEEDNNNFKNVFLLLDVHFVVCSFWGIPGNRNRK